MSKATSLVAAPGVVAFLGVAGLAAAQGGYFPSSWGWATVGLLWVAALALVLRSRLVLPPLERAFVAALGALAVWIALSTTWSEDVPQTVLEVQRAVLYLAGAAAVLLAARPASSKPLVAGVLGAITLVSAYALTTRLFPQRTGVYDPVAGSVLSEPLGYSNGLGIFAALGMLLAVGFAARGRAPVACAFAGAVVVGLAATVYFTFSRGAWLALAVGFAVAVALDPRRLQLVTHAGIVALPAGLAVWLASRADALTRDAWPPGALAAEGRRVTVEIVVLAVAAGLATFAASVLQGRLRFGRRARALYVTALVLVLAVGVGGVFAVYGSPVRLVERAHDEFTAPLPRPEERSSDPSRELLSFSGNGRFEMWGVAWSNYKQHSALGSGAGTYERYWNRHRDVAFTTRDAHSLYLEALAELGPAGLTLLLGVLGVPVLAGVRARRSALVPAALGAYSAYVVHASFDWDWELSAVTLAFLFVGAGLLVAARPREEAAAVRPAVRAGAVVATVLVGAFAFVGLVGNNALEAGARAAAERDWDRAAREARTARRWAPWSAEPLYLLGEVELAQGRRAAARASLRKAVAKDGRDWYLWLTLARTADGRPRRAALAEAARLNPLAPEIAYLRRPPGRPQ